VLNRQRSQVGIGGQISAGADGDQLIAEDADVPGTGMYHGCRRLIHPGADEIKRGDGRERLSEQAGSSGEAEEGQQDVP
jgi:hypothetical protein